MMTRTSWIRAFGTIVGFVGLAGLAGRAGGESIDNETGASELSPDSALASVAWSRQPPGFEPEAVPQFVAVTFDDNNFNLDGMEWANGFFDALQNPAGRGLTATFDGTPVRTTFFHTSIGLDENDYLRQLWSEGLQAGHEVANHTTSHGESLKNPEFSFEAWTEEISSCTAALTDADHGIGAGLFDIIGFRTPFLSYNNATFSALVAQGLVYDSTLQSCWADDEDGSNCSWPHTLDEGSPDNQVLHDKFGALGEPELGEHAGLWEVPVATLIIPPDEVAELYGFEPGLRGRIPNLASRPNYYEPDSGKIVGLDITLFLDAEMTAAEVEATLKYTFDLRIDGNRAPFVFIAHTHVYSSSWNGNAPNASSEEARRGAIENFINYALARSETRMRPLRDIVTWMGNPISLTGEGPRLPGTGGTDGGGGTGGTDNTGGIDSTGGTTPIVDPPNDTRSSTSEPGCACRWGMSGPAGRGELAGLFLIGLWAYVARRRAGVAS